MESSNSNSENECYESAEEGLEDDENDVNTKPNNSLQEPGSELPECLPHSSSVNPIRQVNEEISGNLLSYRRRPERTKRLHCKSLNKSTSKSPDEPIYKADKIVSDVFLQDITTNISKNINRSLTTLQQTSSNVKELIFSTIPVSSYNNNEGFSYDDKQSFFTLADTVIDNKHHESTGSMEDNLEKKEERDQMKMPTKEITFSLAEGQSEHIEGRILASTESKNLEQKLNKMQKYSSGNVILKNTVKKEEYSLEPQQNLEDFDSAYLNLDDISKRSMDDSEHKTDIKTDEVENSAGPHEKSLTTGNEMSEIFKQNDKENIKVKEDSSKEVVKCFNKNLYSGEVTTDEPRVNEKELAEKENTQKEKLISHTVDKQVAVQENLTSPSVSDETNGNVVTNIGGSIKDMLVEKFESDSKCNLKELKTALENIIKEEECDLKNINKNFKEDSKEGEIIFKGKTVDNETFKEGWDDFDFSDSENESITYKHNNIEIKREIEKIKCMADEQINKNKMIPSDVISDNKLQNKSADYNLIKGKMRTGLTEPSSQVINDEFVIENQLDKGRSLIKGNEKHATNEIFEIKPVTHDSWDWDAWGEDADSNGEVVTSETRNSKAEKPKDHLDAVNWSGWDKFGQKSEEKARNWTLGSWGVDMLLNKATTVTQGISNVLEAGLGAPDPETLARMEKMEGKNLVDQKSDESEDNKKPLEVSKKNSLANVNLFPVSGITSLVAEVTSKIVEHSKIQEIGSKVINGGLDTLETFGKKTMEVLQEGDPGLKNKRALLLGDQKPVLSQILREAREKADKELKKVQERELAKKCHFETLFDDFQGMVHLEALEMLSRQYELKLEQLRCGMSSEEQEDFNAILEEVEQLCSLDEYDMDLKSSSKLDFKIKLQMAVEPLKNEISIQKIIQIHDGVSSWLQMTETRPSFNIINQKLVSTLAELAAATVQQFHKSGELLSVKECRKTVEEVDALLRLTNVLCAEINILCEKFILLSKERSGEVNNEKMNSLSENVTTIMINSTSYIRQAFNLLIPVLQFGAAVY